MAGGRQARIVVGWYGWSGGYSVWRIATEPSRNSAILAIHIPLNTAYVSVSTEPPDYNHDKSKTSGTAPTMYQSTVGVIILVMAMKMHSEYYPAWGQRPAVPSLNPNNSTRTPAANTLNQAPQKLEHMGSSPN